MPITPFVIPYLISARRVRNPVYLTGLFALTTATMGLWLANIAAKGRGEHRVRVGARPLRGRRCRSSRASPPTGGSRSVTCRWGSFLFAALLGLIVAGFANLFLASAGFSPRHGRDRGARLPRA